jgi:hypothetical protein
MPKVKSSVPSQELLNAALQGLEAQRGRIDDQIREVRAMLGQRRGRPPLSDSASTSADAQVKTTSKRQLSPAARRRIAAAQKRRWAEYRKQEGKKG